MYIEYDNDFRDALIDLEYQIAGQARTQLEAVCCVRDIRRASVYDLDPAAADRFAAEMTESLGLPVERAETASSNLNDADVVCTATPATERPKDMLMQPP